MSIHDWCLQSTTRVWILNGGRLSSSSWQIRSMDRPPCSAKADLVNTEGVWASVRIDRAFQQLYVERYNRHDPLWERWQSPEGCKGRRSTAEMTRPRKRTAEMDLTHWLEG